MPIRLQWLGTLSFGLLHFFGCEGKDDALSTPFSGEHSHGKILVLVFRLSSPTCAAFLSKTNNNGLENVEGISLLSTYTAYTYRFFVLSAEAACVPKRCDDDVYTIIHKSLTNREICINDVFLAYPRYRRGVFVKWP